MTDDLFEPLTPANPAAARGKCRHPRPLRLFRHPLTNLPLAAGTSLCGSCFTVIDGRVARRGRNNAKRGKAIQRQRIIALGGQNLPGNKPGHDGIGLAFSYESKAGGAFSERYWRWLRGIPATAQQTAVLIVTSADGSGPKARSYVVVEYDDWRDLHQERPEDEP